jgi:hypothetical protein
LVYLFFASPLKANDIWDAWGEGMAAGLVDAGVSAQEAKRSLLKITTLDPMATGPGSWVYELDGKDKKAAAA